MENTPPDAPRQFADWLRERLIRRGYNLSLRGGGQRRFAADAGLSPTSVSRLLRGEANPDADSLRAVADTLGTPFAEVLLRAGVLTPDDLDAVRHRDTDQPHLTPEQAAAELGITDPQAVSVFVATTTALRHPRPDANDRRAER